MKLDTTTTTEKIVGVAHPSLVRPLWMTGGEVNDWPEDAPHENGQYFNKCLSCDGDFIGHKRRRICRKCHYEAKARYDAMTPDEQAAHNAFLVGEIAEFYRTNAKGVSVGGYLAGTKL